MRRPFATDADGCLSLCKGEGEGEGLVGAGTEIEPLTFVLSPLSKGRGGKAKPSTTRISCVNETNQLWR